MGAADAVGKPPQSLFVPSSRNSVCVSPCRRMIETPREAIFTPISVRSVLYFAHELYVAVPEPAGSVHGPSPNHTTSWPAAFAAVSSAKNHAFCSAPSFVFDELSVAVLSDAAAVSSVWMKRTRPSTQERAPEFASGSVGCAKHFRYACCTTPVAWPPVVLSAFAPAPSQSEYVYEMETARRSVSVPAAAIVAFLIASSAGSVVGLV